jgi:hypothetical protein
VLVDDRVDRDRGLARLAVADDQLTLTTTDRDHAVDRLDAGLHRLAHRLPRGNARRLHLERATRVARDRALAVDRVTQRVDDAAEHPVTDGNRKDLAGALNRLSFFNLAVLAEDDGTDLVFLEVHSKTHDAAFELEHLVGHDAGKTGDTGDPVTDLTYDADLLTLGRGLEVLYIPLEYGGDLTRIDG